MNNKKNNLYFVLGAFIVIFIVYILLYFTIWGINVDGRVNSEFTNLVYGDQHEYHKHDCNVESLFSSNDQQCSVMCKNNGTFRSHNGICVNVLAFSEEDTLNSCDSKKGVLSYMVGDPQLGTTRLQCLSIDLGIQPNDPNNDNIICMGGKVGGDGINYLVGFPQIQECDCGSINKILTIIPATSTVRRHGLCVDKKLETIIKHNNLSYNRNEI